MNRLDEVDEILEALKNGLFYGNTNSRTPNTLSIAEAKQKLIKWRDEAIEEHSRFIEALKATNEGGAE